MTDPASRPDPTGHSRSTAVHGIHHPPKTRKEMAWLSLGALGVVYGDIGTSPLYAMRECLSPSTDPDHVWVSPNDPNNVLGVVSLFFWALVLVVVVKYLVF